MKETVRCTAYFEVGGGDATGIDCADTRAQAARGCRCIGAVVFMQEEDEEEKVEEEEEEDDEEQVREEEEQQDEEEEEEEEEQEEEDDQDGQEEGDDDGEGDARVVVLEKVHEQVLVAEDGGG